MENVFTKLKIINDLSKNNIKILNKIIKKFIK